MKATSFTITFTIAFAVLCALPLAARAESITFGAAPVTLGYTFTESGEYSTVMSFTELFNGYRSVTGQNDTEPANMPASVERSVSRDKTVTVTAVVGNDHITGIDVTYTRVVINGTDRSAIYAGKHYLLQIRGSHVASVLYADNSAPPDAEVQFVIRDNSRVGQLREMNRTFSGETVEFNPPDSVAMRVKNPENLVDVEAGFEITGFTMFLTGIETDESDPPNRTATFQVALTMTNDIKKPRGAKPTDPDPFTTNSMSVTLAGPLEVNVATSRILSIDLTGGITMNGEKNTDGKKGSNAEVRKIKLTGSGTATLKSTYAY